MRGCKFLDIDIRTLVIFVLMIFLSNRGDAQALGISSISDEVNSYAEKGFPIFEVYPSVLDGLVQESWLFGADIGINDSSSSIFQIDVLDAGLFNVGESGLDLLSDIAFMPNGRLLGTRFNNTDSDLVEIDPFTGLATIIGSIGFEGVNALVANSDTTLLAATVEGSLISIDATTGTGTFVGVYGSDFGSTGDLAFSLNGTMLAIAHKGTCCAPTFLVQVNVSNGEASEIGPIGFNNVFGLVLGPDGKLYGIADGGENEVPKLIEIDAATGAGTLISQMSTSNGMAGLAKNPIIFRDGFESGGATSGLGSVQ